MNKSRSRSTIFYKNGTFDQVPHIVGARLYLYIRKMEPIDSALPIGH